MPMTGGVRHRRGRIQVHHTIDQLQPRCELEVDGGIEPHTAPLVVEAGARVLVAGSAIFHASDPERATRELKAAALGGLASTAAR